MDLLTTGVVAGTVSLVESTSRGGTMSVATALDVCDVAIVGRRIDSISTIDGPRVGDYVRFADGVERRVSFVTPVEWLPECDSVQTSDGGSWYLGDGYVSFSGGLHPGVKRETLTLTGETKMGRVWIFHHDVWGAGRGIECEVESRVYECSENA